MLEVDELELEDDDDDLEDLEPAEDEEVEGLEELLVVVAAEEVDDDEIDPLTYDDVDRQNHARELPRLATIDFYFLL